MNPPKIFGQYEIVRRLGKSMTDVFLAIDTTTGRKVALKLVPTDGDAVNELVLEAERRGAAIQQELHRADARVVEIYEYGDRDGLFYIAMEFLEGRNLSDVLATEHVIDAERAAVIALELCEQLAVMHEREGVVIHGDIKPSNIHLGHNNTVRLVDFGIAKVLRAGCEATLHQFGSPGYCSPERLVRAEVAPQSDLWALGATLYEMLAGVPPYQAEDTTKLETLIRSKRSPRALPPSCPAGMSAIVTKVLAPEAENRYLSAHEMQADLQAFLEHRPTLAEKEALVSRRARWSASATLEAARYALRRITRTARRMRRRSRGLKVAGGVAWFAAGMVLWIGGSFLWQGWQTHASAATVHVPPVNVPSPTPAKTEPNPDLTRWYIATANQILDAYSKSTTLYLSEFDWHKAEICLQRAVALGAKDDQTLGHLDLVSGYADLDRLGGNEYSPSAAAQLRIQARDAFFAAARKLPGDPRPHLALARVYVYSLPDPDRAMREFSAAEHFGATLGSREIEEQGDAYRIRAMRELKSSPKQARRDAQTARSYYRRIPGFDRVDAHVQDVGRIAAAQTPPPRPSRWR
jgi:serine/threonine-protein kinase